MNQLSSSARAHTYAAYLSDGSEADMEYNLPLNSPMDLDALDEYLSELLLTTAWVCRTSMVF
jgi:hypothetical protein